MNSPTEDYPGQRLHQYAIFDREDSMEDVLKGDERIYINARDMCGRTPVYTAVSNNSIKCLEVLLRNGADPSVPGGERVKGMTPLHHALLEGKKEAMKLLLEYGADLNILDESGLSPLNLAKSINKKVFLDMFLKEDERRYNNALLVVVDLCSACEECDLEKVKDILRLPPPAGFELANMSDPSILNRTPLAVAARTGDVAIMQELLNTVREPRPSPSILHEAIQAQNLLIVELMLQKFPECCNSLDDLNQTPLHIACAAGDLNIVKCLLEWKYPDRMKVPVYDEQEGVEYRFAVRNLNMENSEMKTALYLACEEGFADIVEYLLNFTVPGRRKLPQALFTRRQTLRSDSMHNANSEPVNVSGEEADDSVSYKPIRVVKDCSHNVSCVYIAVKNQHCGVLDLLAKARALSNLTLKAHGKEYSLLLYQALVNEDILIIDRLLRYNMEDINNYVLSQAVHSKPSFIPHFLKYKSSEDKQNTINKALMKKEYADKFSLINVGERVEELSASNPRYIQTFPVQAVNIRWQNLNVLSTVESSWLNCAVNIHNPQMINVDTKIPLFAITKVDVSNNNLSIMPIALLELPSVCTLVASNNHITEFPQLGKFRLECQSLEDLSIQNNRLTDLPAYIFYLPSLRYLNASNNQISTLPSTMWQVSSLKTLDLSNNKLTSLPSPIWTNFASARVDVSQEMVLLEESGGSVVSDQSQSSLEKSNAISRTLRRANHWSGAGNLVISDEAVREAEDKLKGLKTLKLERNKISTFPEFLSCCVPNLENLEMSRNDLTSLGNLACYPRFLKTLDLSNNKLKTMEEWQDPEEGDKCFCDKSAWRPGSEMFTSLNQSCVHRKHTKFETLEVLNLSHNKLTSLVLLRSSGEEIQMSLSSSRPILQLSDKELAEMDLQSRLLFPSLSILNLDWNHLTSLPEVICEQKKLTQLTLACNRDLRELPPSLGLLAKLRRIEVNQCELFGPILDVIKGADNKAEEIRRFLSSILEESEEYNCMNLMIVGSFNIGKTSLLDHLMKKGIHKPVKTHFAERQDKNAKGTTKDGKPLSTVGIDISRLVFDGKKGKVEFRTWDFAGQKEYYATHQYFLRPRSLYLVVWNMTEGQPGVEKLRQWLVNIQTQARSASVIIVGTHLDEIKNKKIYSKDWEASMIKLIQERYGSKIDRVDVGLPNIEGIINVSAGSKPGNIDALKTAIYDIAFSLKHPLRKKENILGNKVPKKYLKLQTCIGNIVKQFAEVGKDPVLDSDSYLVVVMDEMSKSDDAAGTSLSFRNREDLYQATRFLHENGILCHFADTSLKDQYFLDPQWLCDQLAKVVSIQEVQKFAQEGVMQVKHLHKIYRGSDKIGRYILSLLNKFEVALQFDEEHLLLPTLLPTADQLKPETLKEIPVKRKGVELSKTRPGSTFDYSVFTKAGNSGDLFINSTSAEKNPVFSNTRLYLLSYFPSGFWPRLITRLLADETFYDPVIKMFQLPSKIIDKCADLQRAAPVWRCWQTGLELVFLGNVIMQVKEVYMGTGQNSHGMCDYMLDGLRLSCHFNDEWADLDVADSAILEISFQADNMTFNFSHVDGHGFQALESRTIPHDYKAQAAILSKVVDNIDSLLQDWFPDIGESRFQQSCAGRYLVTRVIPCPLCLQEEIKQQMTSEGAWSVFTSTGDEDQPISIPVTNDNDAANPDEEAEARPKDRVICTFLVENCIKNVLDGIDEICSIHQAVSPTYITTARGVSRMLYVAPDLVFQDLDDSQFLVKDEMLTIDHKLGRGAFGTVWAGKLKQEDQTVLDVAVKVLYDAQNKAEIRRQSSQMSLETICAAYTTARQEVSILQSVEHPNIVPLLALSKHPLALLLSLAPMGSLNSILESRHKDGLRLPVWIVKQVIIQTADALDYIHNRKIIYRDLKSDNVLVWNFPNPTDLDPQQTVYVKLADYGISRAVVPAGAKGFGGTPPFIAPEILVHAGRDTYTEKVDIFSFGMFLFELITCRQPLSEINNPTVHVVHGGRPTLTSEEAIYPSHLLDLMTICWKQEASERPSAAQIRMIASCPQFCHLSDTVTMARQSAVLSACSVYHDDALLGDLNQVWMVSTQRTDCLVEIVEFNRNNKYTSSKVLEQDKNIMAVCAVRDTVWCLDDSGTVHIYSCANFELKSSYPLPVAKLEMCLTFYHGTGGYLLILVKEQGERRKTMFCITEEMMMSGDQPGPISVEGNCYCGAIVNSQDSFKTWLGTNNGEIIVRDITASNEESRHLCPYSVPTVTQICYFIVTLANTQSVPMAWSYNYPGSKVFRWDTDRETVQDFLDCSNIIPTTDSQSNTSFRANRYQVTALQIVDRYLYISTTWGCVIVADAFLLQPYSVFRCHAAEEFYCKAILPLGSLDTFVRNQFEKEGNKSQDLSSFLQTDSSQKTSSSSFTRGIVTIGKGYVDMISHVTHLGQVPFYRSESVDMASSPLTQKENITLTNISDYSQTYVLAWIGDQWEYF